ncbi:MAG: murein biosynthesis integral membrane protein MurJ [Actinomycetota bacterium]
MRPDTEAHGSLARGAALISAATAVSRITGFLRVVAVAAALGTTFLANTYQTANTTPNVLFELVAAGVLTSIFVPTFVDYLVKEQREQGWKAANALTSVALVALTALALLVALAAPVLMRVLTIGVSDQTLREEEIILGTRFLRLFAPQIVFYGVGMIMAAALHAYRRFALPAIAPIFNNVVVIIVYVVYAVTTSDRSPTVEGITTGETILLGAGTTAGVLAMTVCLIPPLRRIGWTFRFRFDPSHPAVRKAMRLGVWALGYAGGYQAGLIVVLLLANRVEGGVAAYQWAFTFFYVPHALFAAPIFHVLFPAMSEHVARGEEDALMGRLRDGLGMLAFILVPVGAALVVTASLIARVTLEYGAMTGAGAALVGRVLAAFALGLPTYSAFLVLTRAYYALGDTKRPTLINALTIALASASGALLFFSVNEEWAVASLALAHSIAFAVGAYVMNRDLGRRGSRVGSTALMASVTRALVVGGGAALVMATVRYVLPDSSKVSALLNLIVTVGAGGAFYLFAMARMGAQELPRIRGAMRRAGAR